MNKNLNKRIKPEDIPQHPFFQTVDWELIDKMDFDAPIIPKIVSILTYFLLFYLKKNDLDFSNIDPVFLNEQIVSPYIKLKQYYDDSIFKDF